MNRKWQQQLHQTSATINFYNTITELAQLSSRQTAVVHSSSFTAQIQNIGVYPIRTLHRDREPTHNIAVVAGAVATTTAVIVSFCFAVHEAAHKIYNIILCDDENLVLRTKTN